MLRWTIAGAISRFFIAVAMLLAIKMLLASSGLLAVNSGGPLNVTSSFAEITNALR